MLETKIANVSGLVYAGEGTDASVVDGMGEEVGHGFGAYHWYPSLQSIDVFVLCPFLRFEDPFVFELEE